MKILIEQSKEKTPSNRGVARKNSINQSRIRNSKKKNIYLILPQNMEENDQDWKDRLIPEDKAYMERKRKIVC